MEGQFWMLVALLGPLTGLLGSGAWALLRWSESGQRWWLAVFALALLLASEWHRRWRRRWASRILQHMARESERPP
jgi:hypothetical protein